MQLLWWENLPLMPTKYYALRRCRGRTSALEEITMITYYLSRPRFFGDFRPFESVGFDGGSRLPLDVHVDDDAYRITAAVPGYKPEELKIQILDDVVTVSAEREQSEDGDGQYLMRELPQGEFSRSLRFPEPIDASKAEAKVEHGILTLRLPKAEEARPKTIKVQAK
jgi:HSP20 family protein